MSLASQPLPKRARRTAARFAASVTVLMLVASSVASVASAGPQQGPERKSWVPIRQTLSTTQVVIEEGSEAVYQAHVGKTFADPGAGRSVELRVASSDPAAVAVETPVLTFTGGAGGNWDDQIEVRLSAPPDSDSSYGRATITHTLVGLGAQIALPSVDVGVNDAQIKRAVIVTPAHVTISEGGTAEVTVRLATDPGTGWSNGSVHVLLSDPPYDTPFSYPHLKHSPTRLRLTGGPNGNWDTGATVTMTSRPDDDASDDSYGFVFHTNYYRIDKIVLNDTATVTVLDGDKPPGVTVTPQRITLQEGSAERADGSYQIALNTDPGAEVTVTVANPDPAKLSVSPESVTFGADNPWHQPQTVTVSALHDPAATGTELQMSHTVAGYGEAAAPSVSVVIIDSGAGQGIVARVPTGAPQRLSETRFQYTGPLVEGTDTPCLEGEVCVFWWRVALDPGDQIDGGYDVYSRRDESDPWERHVTADSSRIEHFIGGSHGDWTDWRLGRHHVPADADSDDTFLEFRIGVAKSPTLVVEPDPDPDPDAEEPTRSYLVYEAYTLTVTAVAVDLDRLTSRVESGFAPNAGLLDEVTALAEGHANPKARKRLARVAAGMTGSPGGYTAEECRATARKHKVRAEWKPWCDEIERRENAEAASAETLEQRIRQRLQEADTAASRKLWKRALATIGAAAGQPLTKTQIRRFIKNHTRDGRTDLAQLWQDILDAA